MKRRLFRALIRNFVAALLLCAASFAASACSTKTEHQDLSHDYVAMAGLRLENATGAISQNVTKKIEETARSRQTALRVLARMDAAARKKLTAPYAKMLAEDPSEDDLRVVLQMKLNLLLPKSGTRYLLFFGHPIGETALLVTQLYAEEIAATFRENTSGDAATPPVQLSIPAPASYITIPALPKANP